MAIKKQSFMKGVFVIMGSQILIKILGQKPLDESQYVLEHQLIERDSTI